MSYAQTEKLYNSVTLSPSTTCQVDAPNDQAILGQTPRLSVRATCLNHQPPSEGWFPEIESLSFPPTLDRMPELSECCGSDLPQVERFSSITSVQAQLHEHLTIPPKEEPIHLGWNKSPGSSLSPKRAAEESSDHSETPPKRSRRQYAHHNNGHEDCGPDDEDKNAKKSHEGKEFACPYFRSNPMRHIDCISVKLNRIQDVKQHLRRRHKPQQSPALPQTCGSRVPPSNINGVSETAQARLRCRMNRALKPADQWYSIWEILFEDKPKPETPHLGSVMQEVIRIIQDFWAGESERIISSFVEKKGLSASSLNNTKVLIMRVLDEVRDNLDHKPSISDSVPTPNANSDGAANFVQPQDSQELFPFCGDVPSPIVDTLPDDFNLQSRCLTPDFTLSAPLNMLGMTDGLQPAFSANYELSGFQSANPDLMVSFQPEKAQEMLFPTTNYEGWCNFISESAGGPIDLDFVDEKVIASPEAISRSPL